MSFKLRLDDGKIFKNAFEALSAIVDEVQIQIDSEGLRCSALDRSHITFCKLELSKDLFDEYVCDKVEKINVDTLELMNVLKRMKKNDILECSMDEGNFILVFEGDATKIFRIRFIDMEYNKPEPPKIPVPNIISVPSSIISDAVKDVEIFSDKIEFSIDDDFFIINSSDDFGDVEVKFLHGEEITEYSKSTYGIDKIKDILKSSKFSQTVEVGLGTDMPILLDFNLPTGDGKLGFMLAPRLSEED